MSDQGKRDIARVYEITAPKTFYPLPEWGASPSLSQLNFRWRNQRQVRKNRRRANAAGYKKAFA